MRDQNFQRSTFSKRYAMFIRRFCLWTIYAFLVDPQSPFENFSASTAMGSQRHIDG